jgi:hypothetical protein
MPTLKALNISYSKGYAPIDALSSPACASETPPLGSGDGLGEDEQQGAFAPGGSRQLRDDDLVRCRRLSVEERRVMKIAAVAVCFIFVAWPVVGHVLLRRPGRPAVRGRGSGVPDGGRDERRVDALSVEVTFDEGGDQGPEWVQTDLSLDVERFACLKRSAWAIRAAKEIAHWLGGQTAPEGLVAGSAPDALRPGSRLDASSEGWTDASLGEIEYGAAPAIGGEAALNWIRTFNALVEVFVSRYSPGESMWLGLALERNGAFFDVVNCGVAPFRDRPYCQQAQQHYTTPCVVKASPGVQIQGLGLQRRAFLFSPSDGDDPLNASNGGPKRELPVSEPLSIGARPFDPRRQDWYRAAKDEHVNQARRGVQAEGRWLSSMDETGRMRTTFSLPFEWDGSGGTDEAGVETGGALAGVVVAGTNLKGSECYAR